MAGEIRVNTDLVNIAAKNINNYNGNIKVAFDSLNKVMTSLGDYWDGNVGENAETAFTGIRNAFSEERFSVMENYVVFLHTQVEQGYIETETTNTKLADAFK